MKERRPDELVLEELTEQLDRTRRLLTESPEAIARQALEAMAAPEEEAEARIAARLAAREPLAHLEAFAEAHRLVVRALEVLDGEGARNPPLAGAWALTPVLSFLVKAVAQYIVQAYARSVVGRLRTLYVRREAQAEPGSEARRLLARARIDTERMSTSFRLSGGVALLLAGGAAFPAVAWLANLAGAVYYSRTVAAVALVVIAGLFVLLSFVLVRGAAVAHRRSQVVMRQPLAALWETIGNAGEPPEDHGRAIATVAIVLAGLAWFLVPAIAVAVYLLLM
jgi:hypothetical protein